MKEYEVAIPVTGWIVYRIEAENEEEAKKKALLPQYEEAEYDVKRDLNPATWEVQEL